MRRVQWLVLLFVAVAAAVAVLLFARAESPNVHVLPLSETSQSPTGAAPLVSNAPQQPAKERPTTRGAAAPASSPTDDPEVEIDLDTHEAWKDLLVERDTESRWTDGVKLEGQVLDEAGKPVPQATVIVSGAVSSDKYRKRIDKITEIARTDEFGEFSGTYSGPESALFTIEVFARATDSLDSERQQLEVAGGTVVSGIVIWLPLGGTLSGRVVDEQLNPVQFASLRILPAEGEPISKSRLLRSLLSNANGDFTLKGLPTGNHLLLVGAVGYIRTEIRVAIVAGLMTTQPDIVLRATTGLRLRLTCPAKPPIGGFKIVFFDAAGAQTSTSAQVFNDGDAVIGTVPENAVEIEVHMSGYKTSARYSITPIRGVHVDVGIIELELEGPAGSK